MPKTWIAAMDPRALEAHTRLRSVQDGQMVSRRALVFAAAGATLSTFTGCANLRQWWHNGWKVGPNYVRPAAPVAPDWIDAHDARVKLEPARDCAWWTVFNDPTLNGLVESAYRQNLDLRAAGTRILDARAQRNIAVGNIFPQSQAAQGTYAYGQISKNLGLPLPNPVSIWADGFNVSWELDFWGRYRRSVEAANAQWAAATEQYGEAWVMLISETATNYVNLRTFEQRLEYARKNVAIQQGSLKIAEDRFKAGRGAEIDVRQARANLAQTESLIPPLVAGRRRASNQLCVLMGMPPNDLAAQLGPGPIPIAPVELALGIPADLLRRRPDVRRSEREVAAQSARIGVAEADLYPRLTLNGFLGYVANDFSDLFDSNSFTGIFFPQASWNVLNYGRIANNIRAQDARLQGAALQYQQTVLNASREVEDALVGFLQAQQQAAALEQAVRDAERFVELVLIQFQTGVIDFNRVFNAQASLVTLQDQLATARGNIALSLIQVYRALGGGWEHYLCGGGTPPVHPAENLATPPGSASEILPPAKSEARLPP